VKLVPKRHTPQSCHWSVPTLFMPQPYWLSAYDVPWCCWNHREIVLLHSTDVCAACQLWKPRNPVVEQAATVQPVGATPLPRP